MGCGNVLGFQENSEKYSDTNISFFFLLLLLFFFFNFFLTAKSFLRTHRKGKEYRKAIWSLCCEQNFIFGWCFIRDLSALSRNIHWRPLHDGLSWSWKFVDRSVCIQRSGQEAQCNTNIESVYLPDRSIGHFCCVEVFGVGCHGSKTGPQALILQTEHLGT